MTEYLARILSQQDFQELIINEKFGEVFVKLYEEYEETVSREFLEVLHKLNCLTETISDPAVWKAHVFAYTDLPMFVCEVPEGVQTLRRGSFNTATLHAVILPKTLQTIESYCFAGAELSTPLVIPQSVEHIGLRAFTASQIPKIIYQGTIDEWMTITGFDEIQLPVHCSDGIYQESIE